MKITITGANGQLGSALQQALTDHEISAIDIDEADITDRSVVGAVIKSLEPDTVIHCAAYTDVDGCARDPQLAYSINTMGTRNVADACAEAGAAMVHISTNEIFSGSLTTGYEEWMAPSPGNAYGASKAAAEYFVRNMLEQYYIVRTSWLYAPLGHNFIHAILNRARKQGTIKVVTDEVANPTYVTDLAEAITALILTGQAGVYHLTNQGACSRWAFANEILRQADLGDVRNEPILSSRFRRASTPPHFAALHNRNAASLGITLRPWEDALGDYLQSIEKV